MDAVRVSSKYQIVIPKNVRDGLQIRPGTRMQVFVFDGRIEIVPVRPLRGLRGRLKGIDTSVPRDEDRV
jgi:AbrB family looped-hinge helix DNA binding protein